MKVLLVLALCIAAASAGVVSHTRCGGVGTFREMRIANCEGAICYMTPGTPYACEGDLITSTAAAALRLKVSATYLGFPVSIIDAVLENSSVQPGVQYTVRFTITPNDILSGNTLPVRAEISNDASGLVEICVSVQVHIN
ncbi:uncharacterized protein LOC110853925 [Folsomia candida]|uniref:Mite group 2 allergen Pso o 2 n=1 Tax=Folsomia candida TaxID=158441 RepID=A0A226E0J7_FOLCA|nr:uncharacterized protein LOC110853925 [Folsomia candida]OXA50471.1 Mite group 2 allergen Pso o 2 [Folsomia candida]